MNPNGTFGRDLERWLDDEARLAGPTGLHEEILARARAIRQRPAWIVSVRGEAFPSRGGAFGWFAVARLAVIAVIGVLAVGAAMYLVRPAPFTVGNPSPPRSSQVQQIATTNQGVAMTIQRQDPTDKGRYYWRALTYDQIDLNGWTQTNSTTIVRQPGTQLFEGLADAVDPAGLHSFTFTVTPGDFHGPTIVSPGTPLEVNEPTRLTYVGHAGYFAMLERDGGSGPYTVTALTQPPVSTPGQLTQAELRVAGTGYPQEVKDLYLQVAPGSIGPNARKLEDKVRAEAASSAPFDLASQMVTELHSPTYVYATDVRDLNCATVVYGGMLRDLQARVLPVLRGNDGGSASRPGRADPDRRRVPARCGRSKHGHRDDPAHERIHLGRGLLPGPWLGHVRPDRRQGVPGRTAAVEVKAASDRGDADAAV